MPYLLSTGQIKYLCVSIGCSIDYHWANCATTRACWDQLTLLTSAEVQSILGLQDTFFDFMCDVVILRIGPDGPIYPGVGGLPTIDQQRKERAARVQFSIEAHKKMCAEDPNHPECQECDECDESIELNEDEFNELIQGE